MPMVLMKSYKSQKDLITFIVHLKDRQTMFMKQKKSCILGSVNQRELMRKKKAKMKMTMTSLITN